MEEVLAFECNSSPHFAANFHLIKFRSLHLIIPKWEGGEKKIPGAVARKEDSSEDEEGVE